MAVVCRYLWTWHLYAYHFSQLGIQLISMMIHFHESCHSFESFKRMHYPLSHCVFVPFSHAANSFVMLPDVQREFEEVLTLKSKQYLCQYFWVSPMVTIFTSFQNYVSSFVSSMWDSSWPSFNETFSRRNQLIIWETVLETIFGTLRSVCLNDIFYCSRHRFTSLKFDWKIQLGV